MAFFPLPFMLLPVLRRVHIMEQVLAEIHHYNQDVSGEEMERAPEHNHVSVAHQVAQTAALIQIRQITFTYSGN